MLETKQNFMMLLNDNNII